MMKNEELFITPAWPAPSNVRAYTSLRASQVGNPTEKKINKPLLKKLLALPNEPIWLKQIHSDVALEAHEINRDCEADALFTNKPNQVCAVLTADCLPLLICDQQGKHVAAIHAGWKGLAKGVIENTIKALNCPPDELLVWLGPAIGPKQFEVRKDVYSIFTEHDSDAKACFKQINNEQWLADLYALALLRLRRLGVSTIYGGNFCTYTEEDRFFSFRREGSQMGHNVNLIWLAD